MGEKPRVDEEFPEKDRLIEAVLRVLRLDRRFGKIEEKNVRKILRKLDKSDLTYLANVFDSLYEVIEERFLKEEEKT
ncbi:hypothetical protein IG193_07635 [Infirmifilum lucidum]|uniref:Uncharacterized protein n=1 Tax=Infirmifilum lucidum TaxID=2776706 RepID=A0A7L9FFQ2_9CREN|nr:hypothetical protein [Infirmifilum lucidum]QOJ78620.1 hypothetical protein IG193_07635 [Infirmifilum lucidum]